MCLFFAIYIAARSSGTWDVQSMEERDALKAGESEKVLSQQTTTSQVLPNVDFGKPKCSLVVRHNQCHILNKLLTVCTARVWVRPFDLINQVFSDDEFKLSLRHTHDLITKQWAKI